MRKDPDAKRVKPLELSDLHFLRRLDDTGFTNELGRNLTGPAAR